MPGFSTGDIKVNMRHRFIVDIKCYSQESVQFYQITGRQKTDLDGRIKPPRDMAINVSLKMRKLPREV